MHMMLTPIIKFYFPGIKFKVGGSLCLLIIVFDDIDVLYNELMIILKNPTITAIIKINEMNPPVTVLY